MIETVCLIAGLSAVCSGAAFRWGRMRGSREAAAESAERQLTMAGQRDAAERRARDAQAESTRWRATSLAGEALSSVAVFADRPAPRDAEELARLVRGMVLVDDVVLADRSGNPLTRESEPASADLAALAPPVLEFLRRSMLAALPIMEVTLETGAATHVVARPLLGRGEGTLLVVKTTSRRVNPLVMDAVAHAAMRDGEVPTGLAASLTLAGSTDRLASGEPLLRDAFAQLGRELESDLAAVVLTVDGQPVYSAARNGPDAATRASLATMMSALAERCARSMRAPSIVRIEAAVRGGYSISWSPAAPRSRTALVTIGRADARSSARLDRMLGTLRRSLHGASSGALVEGSAA